MNINKIKHKSMFGRVTPLGRPRSICRSDVDFRFLKFWVEKAKWPWRSRSITLIFNASCGNPKMHIWCKFDNFSSNPLKLSRQVEFLWENGLNDLQGQGQWPQFAIPVESIPGYMFGTNLVNVSKIHNKLSRGQTEFPKIVSQNGQNDLEGQDRWLPFSIPTQSITGCMLSANLRILAQICDNLSCRHVKVYGRTDGWTDAGNDNALSTWKAKG